MPTYYLKYRPQTIEDLDLDNVRFQLKKVLESKHIPHAFLFSGPRGLGKTSSARIVAKALNCESPKGIEPCNVCDACTAITKGSAIDVIEIDGASNRGIDDIRALRESVPSAPLRMKKKVYVIDEVHMLTKEAFNALLKTLEEPPEHVIFVLATTELAKVPETIVSRAFHIQFQRASEAEVKRALQRVIQGEKLTVDDKVLTKIITKAEGGFRDSTKMLEQLAFVNKTIDDTVFNTVFPQADLTHFLTYLSAKDTQKALIWIADQDKQGVDWEDTIRNILLQLRYRMLSSFGIGGENDDLLTLEQIRLLITLFLDAGRQLKGSLVPTLPVELAVATWCTGSEVSIPAGSSSSGNQKKSDEISAQKKPAVQAKITPSETIKKVVTDNVPAKSVNRQKEAEEPIHNDSSRVSFTVELDDIESKWGELLSQVRSSNLSVEALLRSARIEQVLNDTVVIKVYYEFHKGRLEMEKHLQIVEQAFEQVFGAKPKLKYVLGEKHEKKQIEQRHDDDLSKAAEEIFS